MHRYIEYLLWNIKYNNGHRIARWTEAEKINGLSKRRKLPTQLTEIDTKEIITLSHTRQMRCCAIVIYTALVYNHELG